MKILKENLESDCLKFAKLRDKLKKECENLLEEKKKLRASSINDNEMNKEEKEED